MTNHKAGDPVIATNGLHAVFVRHLESGQAIIRVGMDTYTVDPTTLKVAR